MPKGVIVFDATSVLYLTLIGQEHLLAERYGGRSYLPDEVITELKQGEKLHNYNCARLLSATWWRPLAITEPEDERMFFDLVELWGKKDRNRGEAAALTLARRMNSYAVIDDAQARSTAKRFGIRIIGTVGILANMVGDGILEKSEGWAILEDLVSVGFRSPLKNEADFRRLVDSLFGIQ